MPTINETHDPTMESWVDSANKPSADFPIQNLPFGIFRRRGSAETPRVCVAIGDYALDVAACDAEGLFRALSPEVSQACESSSLNRLMSLGPSHWSALRRRLQALLSAVGSDRANIRSTVEKKLVPIAEAELLLPAEIGDYTDFYSSIYHATNVGNMFRPTAPLISNYKYMPVAYHGRASSIVVSGTPVRRPMGQTRPLSEPVRFGPIRELDYEVEMGCFIGPGNPLGTRISLDNAEDHIFGLCILNDWSARDIQVWDDDDFAVGGDTRGVGSFSCPRGFKVKRRSGSIAESFFRTRPEFRRHRHKSRGFFDHARNAAARPRSGAP